MIYKWGCYLCAAKKTKSPAALVGELVDYGFSSSSDTRSFAEEIFARVPRKAAGVNVSFSMSCCELFLLFSLLKLLEVDAF